MCSFFFFYCYLALRDLHSFPTRRSSDLVALARALASDPAIVLLDEPLSAVDIETRTKLLDEIEIAQNRVGIPFIYVTHKDRKSTRLNSSHVRISYAVFCLKKKTKIINLTHLFLAEPGVVTFLFQAP